MKIVGIVGCGPSLKGVDLTPFDRPNVLALKEMMFELPNATGFAADCRWMFKRRAMLQEHKNLVLAVPRDGSKKFPLFRHALYVPRRQGLGMCDEPPAVHMGGSTGYAGLNHVYHDRPDIVLLFGYDYSVLPTAHHYNNARYPSVTIGASDWAHWVLSFGFARPQLDKAGIEVVVAGTTTIQGFRRVTLDEGIEILCKSQ